MDNTLFDFTEAQLSACGMVCAHLGLPGDDGEALFAYFRRPVHGFESHGNIRDFLVDSGVFTPRIFAECCAVYDAQKLAAVTPYPGIAAVLEQVLGSAVPCVVVTDACHANAVQRLDRAGLSSCFATVISPEISGAPKPDPASFFCALETLGLPAGETAVVGDSIRRDIQPAQQAGMITVYARYGDRYAAGRDGSCVPDYCAGDVAELGTILAGILDSRRRAGQSRRSGGLPPGRGGKQE